MGLHTNPPSQAHGLEEGNADCIPAPCCHVPPTLNPPLAVLVGPAGPCPPHAAPR